MIDYEGIDPFDVCMSALALGLITGLGSDTLWVACNVSESAAEFDVAIQASCRLGELVEASRKRS